MHTYASKLLDQKDKIKRFRVPRIAILEIVIVIANRQCVCVCLLTLQTGMISLMEQALFIHPLPSHLAQDYGSIDGGQPHLIYRRSLHDIIGQGCDVSGEITSYEFH